MKTPKKEKEGLLLKEVVMCEQKPSVSLRVTRSLDMPLTTTPSSPARDGPGRARVLRPYTHPASCLGLGRGVR